MEEIDQSRILNGDLLKGESIFATRYAVTTNGLPMKKGDAYFHTLYFLLYDVDFLLPSNSLTVLCSKFDILLPFGFLLPCNFFYFPHSFPFPYDILHLSNSLP